MIRRLFAFTSLIVLTMVLTNNSLAQREGFIPVEGASLKAKQDAATSQGRARQANFWVAYAFDVRPGVAIDYEFNNGKGGTTIVNGASISTGSKVETRNVGVFLLYEPGGSVQSVELYNLDRRRDYSGYKVYWLGRAGNEESLSLLRGLVESNQTNKVSEKAVAAVALHDDARVDNMLEDFARHSTSEKVRSTSVFWLGQTPGHHAYLGELVRNEQESVKLRKEAAFSIGAGRDPQAMATLQNLFSSVSDREVKKQIIFAASINRGEGPDGDSKKRDDAGVDFLIKVAESDPDREVKKQALFWLGQKAGQRSLDALGKVIEGSDDDTEVQKQAVFAISQRPKDEAVPLLIKIARTHQKPEVRKQAIFWLGQTGDERALEFFKEVLTNK
ncbi:MAG TPA: HEAT repeat domain-containing protein [Blastocatellia bacterium]|jgi:HEAT repeat protein|nr:HEAT repeat domain-containing protein [Blastocatellia bacterium]